MTFSANARAKAEPTLEAASSANTVEADARERTKTIQKQTPDEVRSIILVLVTFSELHEWTTAGYPFDHSGSIYGDRGHDCDHANGRDCDHANDRGCGRVNDRGHDRLSPDLAQQRDQSVTAARPLPPLDRRHAG